MTPSLDNSDQLNKRRRADESNPVEESQIKKTRRVASDKATIAEGKNDALSSALANGGKTFRQCPYLGTINRHVLDFDFEKLCSVSLNNSRPYGCLVCGKYFQGVALCLRNAIDAL